VSLLRTILALIILVILAHTALVYLGFEPGTHAVVEAIYGLSRLLQVPANLLLPGRGFYTTALVAAGGYFVVYMLLGIGRRA
jgi:hypothetical protein